MFVCKQNLAKERKSKVMKVQLLNSDVQTETIKWRILAHVFCRQILSMMKII